MKVLIFDTAECAKKQAADRIIRKVQLHPRSVLGLATGGTMEAVYAHIVTLTKVSGVTWSKVQTFNLDEYWGIAPDSAASYRTYMNRHLFDHVDVLKHATHVPTSNGCDPRDAGQDYENSISKAGGIDLQLLGIGTNGHIGFNEPMSSLASNTRLKTLTGETRQANLRYFDNIEDVPKFALTVGIGTILRSKDCLLVATGPTKATALKAMIEGPVSAACPASALQMHQNVTVMIDQEAATDLNFKSYYKHVHPDGQDPVLTDA